MNEIRNETIELRKLDPNEGQIMGLPKNPRYISEESYAALRKSVETAPEMFKFSPLVVVEQSGRYVVICGNMRLRALRELGRESVECVVLPSDTPAAKLREYTMKDNESYGKTDWDLLANEWELEELTEWGIELPTDWGELEEEEDENEKEQKAPADKCENCEYRIKAENDEPQLTR